MTDKKSNQPFTPADIKRLAKKIISENPIFIPDEPTTVGSPDNLTDEPEEPDNERPTKKEPERSKK